MSVIIVTGASRGLGLAIARSLVQTHGARLATLQRTVTPELKDLAAQFPDRVLNVTGDVAKPEDNKRVVDETVGKWGKINGVIVNAGTLEPMGTLATVPLDSLVPSLQTNLLAVLYLLQPALPYLRESATPESPARVVLVSSGASATGYQAWGMYSLAKAGVNSLARTFAAEEKDKNVAFLSIRPGVVDTDMQKQIRSAGPGVMSATDMTKFQSLHESGQLLAPERPGSVIAGCAVGIGMDVSGEYVNWEDGRFAKWRHE